jgi:hypothetical protein
MIEKRPPTHLILFNLGVFFLLLTVLPFALQSLLFLVRIPVNPVVFPVCIVLAFSGLIYQFRQLSVPVKTIICLSILVVLLLVGSHVVSMVVYDFSYDGLWYHQDAVILLEKGWNPNTHVLTTKETSLSDLYLNHYPKATWITQACYYSFLPFSIEGAKSINFYMVFACFFLSLALIRNIADMKWVTAIPFALFIALNPVAVCQLFTFYVDGLVGSIITCTVCLMIFITKESTYGKQAHLYLALTLVFLVSIKFTSLVYACILMTGFAGYQFFYQKERWFKNALFYAGVFIAGILVMGYSTYVRNTLQNGHPFYPLMGENNIGDQVAKVTMPSNFLDKNRFEKFNLATFARPEWARAPLNSRAKPLFSIESLTEFDAFMRPDAEMSGFGPLYAEIFLLMGGGIVLLILFGRKVFSAKLLMLLGVLMISIVIMPAFWYARYAPQIWLFTMIAGILFFQSKATKWLAWLILVFTFVNIGFVMQQNFVHSFKNTIILNQTFDQLKSRQSLPYVNAGWVQSFKLKMKEQGVEYIPFTDNHPKDSIVLFPGVEMSNAFYLHDK